MNTKIDFNNKKILITGGAGFIGSNLAFFFQKKFPKAKVTIFDSFRNNETFENGNLKSYGHYKNLIGFNGDVICGNINSKHDLDILEKSDFNFIFHHAAISDTRIYDQEAIFRTNLNSFYDFLRLAKKNKSVLVYASSAATYGNLPSPQIVGRENPENPYGYSKYAMDQIASKFADENKELIIIGLRFFNVYGPREFYKEKTSSMILQLGHQILDNKSPRLFEGSSNIFRDFIYIDDVIQANIKACLATNSGIYNVGTGIERSFNEVAEILQQELGIYNEIEYFTNPYHGYQLDTKADISSTIENLNFKPQFSLEAGIKEYLPEIKRIHKNKNI